MSIDIMAIFKEAEAELGLRYIPKSREPEIYNGLCYILLATGEVAFCDAEDYELVKGSKYYNGTGYPRCKRDGKGLFLHQILNPNWEMTDHINGNKLDNRRENLRECNSLKNMWNKRSYKGSSSRYKGVYWDTERGKWSAGIRFDGKRLNLGYFDSERNAALAYDRAAKKYFGVFAKLNFSKRKIEA